MITALTARARQLGISVHYVSVIDLGAGRQEDKLGGWEGKRGEIQIRASVEAKDKVFVLAHELTHAELALGYDERPAGCAVVSVEEMEDVVHNATQSWLEARGVAGYKEFCERQGRRWRGGEELRQVAPGLAALSEWLSKWMTNELEGLEGEL